MIVKRSVSLPAIRKPEDEPEPRTPRLKEKGKRGSKELKNSGRSERELKVLQEHWD